MRTVLYVRQRGACWELTAGDLLLCLYVYQNEAVDRALEMVKTWPEKYEICVEDQAVDQQVKQPEHAGYPLWIFGIIVSTWVCSLGALVLYLVLKRVVRYLFGWDWGIL